MMRRYGCVQPSRTSVFVIATMLAAILAQELPAFATSCSDICPGTGACTIGSMQIVDPGSELDCSGRDITIGDAGTVKVIDGELTIQANNLTLNGPGGAILAVEGPDEIVGSIEIVLTGSLALLGKIRANGSTGGGTIFITAAGDISIEENGTDGIEADGTAAHADGGDVRIEAQGDITISDPIHAEGASSGDNQGGDIEIRAGGSIVTDQHGHLSAPGRSRGGGSITMVARQGSLTLNEHVDVDGIGETGAGGRIDLSAGDRIDVNLDITARGGVNQGGGLVPGGTVRMEAGCGGIHVAAPILVTGGDQGQASAGVGAGGGGVFLQSRGSVEMASSALVDLRGLAAGSRGGTLGVRSSGHVGIASGVTVDVRGSATAGGNGGGISIIGCSADVASGAILDARGNDSGNVELFATLEPAPLTPTPLVAAPLHVHSAAQLRTESSGTGEHGRIRLAALYSRKGVCSNNETLRCQRDTDCTVGCQTGDCLYANPDTDGAVSQFSPSVELIEESALGDCRLSACAGM